MAESIREVLYETEKNIQELKDKQAKYIALLNDVTQPSLIPSNKVVSEISKERYLSADDISIYYPPNYNPSASWIDKIKFVLNLNKKIATSTTIINELVIRDRSFASISDVRSRNNRILSTLSIHFQTGKGDTLGRIKIGSEFYYGLSEWFNENGTVKDQYHVNNVLIN